MAYPNNTLPPDKRFLGVVLPVALAAELKATAEARNTTTSAIVRDALQLALSNPNENKV